MLYGKRQLAGDLRVVRAGPIGRSYSRLSSAPRGATTLSICSRLQLAPRFPLRRRVGHQMDALLNVTAPDAS